MALQYLAEDAFLRKFAVGAYNGKYFKRLDYTNCTINSTDPSYGYQYGYQIETIRGDDAVTIQFYFNLGKTDHVHVVRLETTQNKYALNALGDEVYVVLGEVNEAYVIDGIYSFRWIDAETGDAPLIAFMDGDFLGYTEEGRVAVYIEPVVIG